MSYVMIKTLKEHINYVAHRDSYGTYNDIDFNLYKINEYQNLIINEISKFYNINIEIVKEIYNNISDDTKSLTYSILDNSNHSTTHIFSGCDKFQKITTKIRQPYGINHYVEGQNNMWALGVISYYEKKINDFILFINSNISKITDFNSKIIQIFNFISMLRIKYPEIKKINYCCKKCYILGYYDLYDTSKKCEHPPRDYYEILKEEELLNNHYEEIINLKKEYLNIQYASPTILIDKLTKYKIPSTFGKSDIYNDLFFNGGGIKNIYDQKKFNPKEYNIEKFIDKSKGIINYNDAKIIIIYLVNLPIENENISQPISRFSRSTTVSKNIIFPFERFMKMFIKQEGDTLLALQLINKFASENKIRVDDAKELFCEWIKEFKYYNKSY